MTSVSLFQFSLCFKSPRTPQKCGVFVCLYFWTFLLFFLSHHAYAKPKAEPKEIRLTSNISSDLSATDQIRNVFGKYSIESPELYDGNHQSFEHIKIVKDKDMKSAFIFHIHRDLDGDRDKNWPKGKERQRNEIKGYQSSPESLKGKISETHYIKWCLKIDKSFKVTKAFCHFFQLKAVGSQNVDAPVLTLSGVNEGGIPQLQLQWWTAEESKRTFLFGWEECKGKWLICESRCHYNRNGYFQFSIQSLDGLLNVKTFQKLETWREGFSFVRPKWGIYRSIAGVKDKMNLEDHVLINNILVKKK